MKNSNYIRYIYPNPKNSLTSSYIFGVTWEEFGRYIYTNPKKLSYLSIGGNSPKFNCDTGYAFYKRSNDDVLYIRELTVKYNNLYLINLSGCVGFAKGVAEKGCAPSGNVYSLQEYPERRIK